MLDLTTLKPPLWINTISSLEEMLADLSTHSRLAVDTESNSLHAYREQVCLIQFSTSKDDYLVDPLATNDLSLMKPVFQNPAIEKIFHAAEYDLICLSRDFGIRVENLFDTMHAARVLGYEAVGLDKILADKFNIQVDKRHQKADWGARPLTSDQIHYARIDTHFLLPLRDELEKELRIMDRWELAREDFRRAAMVESPKVETDGYAVRRFAARKDITNRELTILNELCLWRETVAEQLNRPLYKVMIDDQLLSLAKQTPAHAVDLAAIGLSQRQIEIWGEAILTAIERGLNAPVLNKTSTVKPDDSVLTRLDKLKNWRKAAAKKLGVESDIVLPRQYLMSLAMAQPKNNKSLVKVMSDSPTRAEQFGDQILKVLKD